jgi:hypothetical protein
MKCEEEDYDMRKFEDINAANSEVESEYSSLSDTFSNYERETRESLLKILDDTLMSSRRSNDNFSDIENVQPPKKRSKRNNANNCFSSLTNYSNNFENNIERSIFEPKLECTEMNYAVHTEKSSEKINFDSLFGEDFSESEKEQFRKTISRISKRKSTLTTPKKYNGYCKVCEEKVTQPAVHFLRKHLNRKPKASKLQIWLRAKVKAGRFSNDEGEHKLKCILCAKRERKITFENQTQLFIHFQDHIKCETFKDDMIDEFSDFDDDESIKKSNALPYALVQSDKMITHIKGEKQDFEE